MMDDLTFEAIILAAGIALTGALIGAGLGEIATAIREHNAFGKAGDCMVLQPGEYSSEKND